MSDEATNGMSSEDKFFGVKATFDKSTKEEETPNIELEVVDDRPEGDRRPSANQAASDNDDELENYGDKVKKRINKLRYQQHEERRKREEAERLREEAIKVAQQYASQAQQYQQIINQGEHLIHQQAEERARAMFEKAKQEYRAAYEEGNTDKVLEAQEAMMNAQTEAKAAGWNARQAKPKPQPKPQPRVAPQQSAPKAPPTPTPRAQDWASENPWFGKEKDMTALAYGVHERLVQEEGIAPDSDEYYETIDRTMRSKFPEYFGEDESGSGVMPSSTRQSPPVVTAPSQRNNGAKPRKVRLSRTQISLAKRLGLTPEQYANQLLKES
ncbi:MAG: hypothetical protein ACYSW8_16305 [Planctomycetota bacterium]|jgi:DNA polymerase III gamma/tau subunit